MVSKKQIAFIRKLQESSPERENEVHAFLKSIEADSIDDLQQQDASRLIDRLLNIKIEGSDNDRGPTGKQISFLESLMRDEPRRKEAERQMKSLGVKNLNGLTLDQASELIEVLKSLKVESSRGDRLVSEKQKKFIASLIERSNGKAITGDFLSKLGKKSIDEITSAEASRLIDVLKPLAELRKQK